MSTNSSSPLLKVVTIDESTLIAERIDSILSEIEGISALGNACNFSSALNLINAVKPDVIILDIHMGHDKPEESGTDLLIEIRQRYPHIKLIVFTNHNELHYRLACLETGVNYFFDKSNDSNKVTETLKQWIIKK